jgi:phosphate transport system protein
LINEMIANPTIIDHANFLVWAAHNLERLSDRVTNICERTLFVVTGEMRELDVSNGEMAR